MDPKKQLTNLDPKLKETYDRVMGTNLSTATPPQVNTPPQINTPPSAQQPAPINEVPKPAPDAVGVVTTIHTEEVKQMAHPPSTTVLKRGSSGIYLVIAVVLFIFFIIYAIVWFKYFNIPVPFISNFI